MKTNTANPGESELARINRRLGALEKRMDEMTRPAPGWFDAGEVCKRFGFSTRTFNTIRRSGKVASSKMGGKVYYLGTDFEKLHEGSRATAAVRANPA